MHLSGSRCETSTKRSTQTSANPACHLCCSVHKLRSIAHHGRGGLTRVNWHVDIAAALHTLRITMSLCHYVFVFYVDHVDWSRSMWTTTVHSYTYTRYISQLLPCIELEIFLKDFCTEYCIDRCPHFRLWRKTWPLLPDHEERLRDPSKDSSPAYLSENSFSHHWHLAMHKHCIRMLEIRGILCVQTSDLLSTFNYKPKLLVWWLRCNSAHDFVATLWMPQRHHLKKRVYLSWSASFDFAMRKKK